MKRGLSTFVRVAGTATEVAERVRHPMLRPQLLIQDFWLATRPKVTMAWLAERLLCYLAILPDLLHHVQPVLWHSQYSRLLEDS